MEERDGARQPARGVPKREVALSAALVLMLGVSAGVVVLQDQDRGCSGAAYTDFKAHLASRGATATCDDFKATVGAGMTADEQTERQEDYESLPEAGFGGGDTYDAGSVAWESVDPCELLKADQAEDALGGDFSEGAPNKNGRGEPLCVFEDKANGGFVNITVAQRLYESAADWQSAAALGLNYQGTPDNGPWASGLSACFRQGCAVSFLAGRIGVLVFVAQGPAGGGEEAFLEGVEDLARTVAGRFRNA